MVTGCRVRSDLPRVVDAQSLRAQRESGDSVSRFRFPFPLPTLRVLRTFTLLPENVDWNYLMNSNGMREQTYNQN